MTKKQVKTKAVKPKQKTLAKPKELTVNFTDLFNVLNESYDNKYDISFGKLIDVIMPHLSDKEVIAITQHQIDFSANTTDRILNIAAKQKTLGNFICGSIYEAIDGGNISVVAKKEKMKMFSEHQLHDIVKNWPNMLEYIANPAIHAWFLDVFAKDDGDYADNGYTDAELVNYAKKALTNAEFKNYLAKGKDLCEKTSVWAA